ncbi:MAG: molybdenum cofactor guanylyltransferase [Bacteroidota bacterium]
MIQKKNISAIILSGGKSSRMGTDKALLQLEGKTFLERIVDVVTPLVCNVVVIGDQAELEAYNLQHFPDLIPNSGPMAGIFTGLFYSESEYNLILSCDIPMINVAVIQELMASSNLDASVNQLKSDEQTLPLVAIYKKTCMHSCLEALKKGERRLQNWVAQLETNTIPLDPKWEPYIRNINTPAQWDALKNEIEH